MKDLINGFDKFGSELKKMKGKHVVSLTEMLSNEFIRKHTKFNSVDDFLNKSGFNFESQIEFDKIPENDLDRYAKVNTSFHTWQQMLDKAGTLWAEKMLNDSIKKAFK